MKVIEFAKDIVLDGIKVKAGDVRPLSELPLDHVACAVRLGYATQIDTPEPEPAKAESKPQPKK